MRDVLDIANYFLHKVDREVGDVISPKKLQKLVYYAQVWSMVLRGKPMFSQTVEAWVHGPVVRKVWDQFREYKFSAIPEPEECLPNLDVGELETLDYVWNRYGELSANQLEKLTHSEPPWKNAREGLCPDERSNEPILLEDMGAYHTAESPWGDIPVQEQEILKALIYELLDRQRDFGFPLSPQLEGLKNTVLDAVEREDPHYHAEIADALTEAFNESDPLPPMNSDEFREWLSTV